MTSFHKPVLLKEVIKGLHISEGDIVVDGTLGGGGYARSICGAIGKSGILIGIDQDASAVVKARESVGDLDCESHFFEGNFRDLDKFLKRLGIKEINAVVFDLGLSTDQLEKSGRGFSFSTRSIQEPLLMTFKEHPKMNELTAAEIVNNWDEPSIANVIYGYGEEQSARKIASAIVRERNKKRIETVGDLVEIIEDTISGRGKLHRATKTFQALRIAVNDELGALEEGLHKGFQFLVSGGRIIVVSFHSLEDRIVKRFFKKEEEKDRAKIITKKPIAPTNSEVLENPRSRSAKLRILQKL